MVTKREARGYALASLINSIMKDMSPERRGNYYQVLVKIVEGYKYYSTKETKGTHPRSVENRTPQLVDVDYNSARGMGFFVARVLEDGLVKEASEKSRDYFLNHFKKFYAQLSHIE